MPENNGNLVSIILPIYNGEEYLVRCVSSIFSQTYQHFEILVSDDNSTDRSIEVIENFKSDKIKLVRNADNIGLSKSRKNLLSKAKGRWIAFIDQDDFWEPEKLEKQIDLLQKYACAMCHTYYQLRATSVGVSKVIKSFDKVRFDDLLRGNSVGASTVLIDRKKFSDFTNFCDSRLYDSVNDYVIWLEVLRETGSYSICCKEVLLTWNFDGNNLSRNKIKQLKRHFDVLRHVEKIELRKCVYYAICNFYNKIRMYLRSK